MKILIIGGGNMGLTYAQSFLRSHITTKNGMMILTRSEERALALTPRDIGRVFCRAEDCIPQSDIVILAVKPQDAPALFEQIRPFAEQQQVFLSIMAGVRMDTIRQALGVTKVVRAMPNLPAQTGSGMTAYTAADEVTRIELVMIQNLLSTTGKAIYVEKESAIDAATAISGSGPAYVYYFMQSMTEAARQLGFSEAEAEILVAQTFSGALDLYNSSNFSCNDWIKKVASKGGTTEAALRSFGDNDLQKHIAEGAKAAFSRAVELGK